MEQTGLSLDAVGDESRVGATLAVALAAQTQSGGAQRKRRRVLTDAAGPALGRSLRDGAVDVANELITPLPLRKRPLF